MWKPNTESDFKLGKKNFQLYLQFLRACLCSPDFTSSVRPLLRHKVNAVFLSIIWIAELKPFGGIGYLN